MCLHSLYTIRLEYGNCGCEIDKMRVDSIGQRPNKSRPAAHRTKIKARIRIRTRFLRPNVQLVHNNK